MLRAQPIVFVHSHVCVAGAGPRVRVHVFKTGPSSGH